MFASRKCVPMKKTAGLGGKNPKLNKTKQKHFSQNVWRAKPHRHPEKIQLHCELLFDPLPPRLDSSIHGYQWLLRRHSIYSGLCALRLTSLGFGLCGTVLFIYSIKLQLCLASLDVQRMFLACLIEKYFSAKCSKELHFKNDFIHCHPVGELLKGLAIKGDGHPSIGIKGELHTVLDLWFSTLLHRSVRIIFVPTCI